MSPGKYALIGFSEICNVLCFSEYCCTPFSINLIANSSLIQFENQIDIPEKGCTQYYDSPIIRHYIDCSVRIRIRIQR